MNKQEIISAIKSLASAQGFYSSLYNAISQNTPEVEEYLDFLEKKNFVDVVDMVLYLEQ